jgi:hypothetical protein
VDEDNLSSTSTTTPTPRIASTVSISPCCYTIVVLSITTIFDVEGLSFQEPFPHTLLLPLRPLFPLFPSRIVGAKLPQ